VRRERPATPGRRQPLDQRHPAVGAAREAGPILATAPRAVEGTFFAAGQIFFLFFFFASREVLGLFEGFLSGGRRCRRRVFRTFLVRGRDGQAGQVAQSGRSPRTALQWRE